MAFMGYETPVEMPSMGIYNTDLMKMYIAGVKDQYEKGQEEMKDFMKLYGDFYSPIAGDTQRYNDMTIGGARNMINQMLANGIDPYKSPEARAAISRYIASVPTGTLNAMKQNAENRKVYDQAVAQARLSGKYDPEYEAWALKQAGLDNFSTIGPNGEVRVWDRLAPDPKQQWADVAAPYLKEFDKTEKLDSDVKGYTKWGVSDVNKKAGVDAVMNAANSTPWLQYKLQQAYDRTAGLTGEDGAPLSEERRRALAAQDVRRQAEDTAAQYYQPKYEVDPYYKSDYETANNIREYWATTGANLSPSSPTSRSNGRSPGGAHGDSGKYSRYADITYNTQYNRSEYVKNAIQTPIYSTYKKDSKGNRVKVKDYYPEMITYPGTDQKVLAVQISKGGFVVNGKHYRVVEQSELQRKMFRDVVYYNNQKSVKTSAKDLWDTQAVKTGNDQELTEIPLTPTTFNNIYSIGEVMNNAVGAKFDKQSKYFKSITSSIRKWGKKVFNDSEGTKIFDAHESADIELKNGHVGKYKLVSVLNNNKREWALQQIGEYYRDENNYLRMCPEWATRMGEEDRIESAASVGEGDAVEIANY